MGSLLGGALVARVTLLVVVSTGALGTVSWVAFRAGRTRVGATLGAVLEGRKGWLFSAIAGSFRGGWSSSSDEAFLFNVEFIVVLDDEASEGPGRWRSSDECRRGRRDITDGFVVVEIRTRDTPAGRVSPTWHVTAAEVIRRLGP